MKHKQTRSQTLMAPRNQSKTGLARSSGLPRSTSLASKMTRTSNVYCSAFHRSDCSSARSTASPWSRVRTMRGHGIGSLFPVWFMSSHPINEAEVELEAEVAALETREGAGVTMTGETSERKGHGARRKVTRRL